MRLAVLGSKTFANRKLVYGLLDLYYYDDPEMILITCGQGHDIGATTFAQEWAFAHDVQCNIHFSNWRHSDEETTLLMTHDVWSDADEGITFWTGEGKFTQELFEIPKRQQKTSIVVLSNNETECEIYDEY